MLFSIPQNGELTLRKFGDSKLLITLAAWGMRPLPHLIIYVRILLCCHIGHAAQTDANLSAHLRRLPTPPPYLRQLRLPLSRGAGIGCWMWLLLGRGAGIGCWMRLLSAKGAGVGWQMLLLVVRGAVPANHRAHFQNANAS